MHQGAIKAKGGQDSATLSAVSIANRWVRDWMMRCRMWFSNTGPLLRISLQSDKIVFGHHIKNNELQDFNFFFILIHNQVEETKKTSNLFCSRKSEMASGKRNTNCICIIVQFIIALFNPEYHWL